MSETCHYLRIEPIIVEGGTSNVGLRVTYDLRKESGGKKDVYSHSSSENKEETFLDIETGMEHVINNLMPKCKDAKTVIIKDGSFSFKTSH